MENFKHILYLLFLVLFFQTTYADPPLPTPVGRVVWVQGVLKAFMENKEERDLKKMSVIYLHDTLVTDDHSKAEIAFTDDTLMTFDTNTKFSIDDYAFKAKKSGTGSVGKFVMTLITGGFRTITGLISKTNPDDYKINTPVATIGVRGTDYAVHIDPNGKLHVAQYKGHPCVRNKKGAVCLDDKTRFSSVTENEAPVPESEQPDAFNTQLEIVPFKVAPFGFQSTPGGPVTSFCIS